MILLGLNRNSGLSLFFMVWNVFFSCGLNCYLIYLLWVRLLLFLLLNELLNFCISVEIFLVSLCISVVLFLELGLCMFSSGCMCSMFSDIWLC